MPSFLPALLGDLGTKEVSKKLVQSAVPAVTQALTPAATNAVVQATAPEVATSLSKLLPARSSVAVEGVADKNVGLALPNIGATTGRVAESAGLNALLPPQQTNELRGRVMDVASARVPETPAVLETTPTELRVSEKAPVSLDSMLQGEPSPVATADNILPRREQISIENPAESYVAQPSLLPNQNVERPSSLSSLLGGEMTQPSAGQTGAPAQVASASGVTTAETQTPATAVMADATKATTTATSPTTSTSFGQAQRNVAEQFGISGAGAGQGGGGGITITPASSPEDAGFNVPLKMGNQKTIKINTSAARTTAAQKNARFKDDNWLKGMNATSKQYATAIKKSNSFGGYYKTPAARAQANNLNAANIGDRVQAMLDVRQNGVSQAEQYATEQGIRVNLPSIELTQPQAQSLAANGVDIDSIVKSGTATPVEAEKIYKLLRDDGYRLSNATDGTSLEKSRAYSEMAKKVSSALNDTMDSLNIDYKTALLQDAANIGEDNKYLAEIAKAPDFKFSDLRSDMADLMTLKDLAGNKLKNTKNINIAGVDTGIPNPATGLGEKIRGAYYNAAERLENARAGAGAAGGAGGAGTSAGDYTFTGGDGSASGLANLLGGAKKVAPYAAAAGIGFMAGRGGDTGTTGTLGADMASLSGQTVTNTDPYQTVTIGGYNYQQLEDGYFNALAAGDTAAANQISQLLDVLQARIERTSSSSDSMSAGMNILNQLYDLYQQMGGAQGVVGGNVTNALNTLSGGAYNSDVATYNQTRALTSSMLARALGEKGTLSDADRRYINENLPKVTDDPTVAEKKFRAIYNMLQTATKS